MTQKDGCAAWIWGRVVGFDEAATDRDKYKRKRFAAAPQLVFNASLPVCGFMERSGNEPRDSSYSSDGRRNRLFRNNDGKWQAGLV